ncbi:MAG: NADH-quinone oxidoreductase subunit C, partial [Planctomycetes bacterium]|nr:NADH-quinone oxidoreductase subunit C [Planctomycetota bacterium]
MADQANIVETLQARFGAAAIQPQATCDGLPTVWVGPEQVRGVLAFLQAEVPQPYRMLYDLTAIDERERVHRAGQPPGDFTVVYHLLSLDRAADVRVKVALAGERPSVPTVTDLWPSANWYERELWDMFGVTVTGHPRLTRILM